MATRSKMSLTNELRIDIALLEIPVSGWTCFKTLYMYDEYVSFRTLDLFFLSPLALADRVFLPAPSFFSDAEAAGAFAGALVAGFFSARKG